MSGFVGFATPAVRFCYGFVPVLYGSVWRGCLDSSRQALVSLCPGLRSFYTSLSDSGAGQRIREIGHACDTPGPGNDTNRPSATGSTLNRRAVSCPDPPRLQQDCARHVKQFFRWLDGKQTHRNRATCNKFYSNGAHILNGSGIHGREE